MENIQNCLQDISNQILLELLHSCVDDICDRKRQYRYENFKSCTNWSKNDYEGLNTFFKTLICEIFEDGTPEQKIMNRCPEISSEHLQCILDCLAVRKIDIENMLLHKSFCVSGSKLEDFDWKLKWVMGSSALSSFREPLMLIDLNLQEDAGGSKYVNLELDRNELKTLLSSLEKAQENVRNWQN